MTKASVLLKLIEGSQDELEFPVELSYEKINGWYISHKGKKFNINNLVSHEWKDKAFREFKDSDEAIVMFTGTVSGGSPPSGNTPDNYDPGSGPDVEVSDVTLHIEGEEEIDIDHEIANWNELRWDLEELALEKVSNDDEPDYDRDDT